MAKKSDRNKFCQIPVRLYRQHDMDLIRIYMQKTIRFSVEMRNAAAAIIRNEPYEIDFNDITADYKGYLQPIILIHVSLNKEDYKDVLAKLETLKKGQRGSFMKAAMRSCMKKIPISLYFSGDGVIMSISEAEKEEAAGKIVEGNRDLVNRIKKDRVERKELEKQGVYISPKEVKKRNASARKTKDSKASKETIIEGIKHPQEIVESTPVIDVDVQKPLVKEKKTPAKQTLTPLSSQTPIYETTDEDDIPTFVSNPQEPDIDNMIPVVDDDNELIDAGISDLFNALAH